MYISGNRRTRIGWSCWGFLGKGIVDTPDGGRSHRYPLINNLIKSNCSVIMLQKNRDLLEVGDDFTNENLTFSNGYPEIDVLFLEYRWPIEKRNVRISESNTNFTPDYQRQKKLISYYSNKQIPILVWDKDQKLKDDDSILSNKNIVILEPSLFPAHGRRQLLFPLSTDLIEKLRSNIPRYSKEERSIGLVYIGNQYERDDSFNEYINAPLGVISIKNEVYGNWTKYDDKYRENLEKYKNVTFKGRIGFDQIYNIYKKSFLTVLIAPQRYYDRGQFTQRLFEAISELCIPLTPSKYKGANQVIIDELLVENANDVVERIKYFDSMSNDRIVELLDKQIKKLSCFDINKQTEIIIKAFTN